MTNPTPPVNVRLEYSDGRVVPLECFYLGLDDEDLHQWEAVTEIDLASLLEGQACLRADVLPERTSLVLSGLETHRLG